MSRTFVCSEFGGLESNLELARKYCKYAMEQGRNPLAPHLLFPQLLDDGSEDERALGIRLGIEWMKQCKEMWVFVVEGNLSKGMLLEIWVAKSLNIPIKWFSYQKDILSEGVIVPMPKSVKRFQKEEMTFPYPLNKASSDALGLLAEQLKAGVKYEALQGNLDSIIGPLDSFEADEEADLVWETEYRESK